MNGSLETVLERKGTKCLSRLLLFRCSRLTLWFFEDVILGKVDKQVSIIADTGISRKDHHNFHAQYVNIDDASDAFDNPHTTLFAPIFRELSNASESDIVALIIAILPFDRFLADLSPENADGIYGKDHYRLVSES